MKLTLYTAALLFTTFAGSLHAQAPVIISQPLSQTLIVGDSSTLSVTVLDNSSQSLPAVSSGTVRLWLKADAGVVTNSSGQVSQWQDQSGDNNHASQSNANLQPR